MKWRNSGVGKVDRTAVASSWGQPSADDATASSADKHCCIWYSCTRTRCIGYTHSKLPTRLICSRCWAAPDSCAQEAIWLAGMWGVWASWLEALHSSCAWLRRM
jgi:hypothetical protein